MNIMNGKKNIFETFFQITIDYVGDLTPPTNLRFNPVKEGMAAYMSTYMYLCEVITSDAYFSRSYCMWYDM